MDTADKMRSTVQDFSLPAMHIVVEQVPLPSSGWELKDWLALATALTGIIALVASVVTSARTLAAARRTTEATLWQKANEADLKQIEERLRTLYAPLMQASELNRLLARDLRSRQGPDVVSFILIEKLFDRAWMDGMPPGQRALLDQIVANAARIERFLDSHDGASEELVPYLARAVAHYRMLGLAAKGELGCDPHPWIDLYVYPRAVDDVLAVDARRLRERVAWLRAHPSEAAPPLPALQIPDRLALKPWPDPPREGRPELTVPVGKHA